MVTSILRMMAALFLVQATGAYAAAANGHSTPIAKVQATTDGTLVLTDKGWVQGNAGNGYVSFLGIPYAAPPVGTLRWKPPQAVAPWTGVLQATQFANQCPQQFPTMTVSEDCLYLNVYVPSTAAPDHPLPVLVWFYGGGWAIGASQNIDGYNMAVKGGVIVVTVNYRLGALGFYASPALDNESPFHVSGNYALLDEQAALRWVQRNILAFGGNPAAVTITGESAGAISGWVHMVAPSSFALFRGVIAQSGPEPIDPPPGTGWTRGLGGTTPLAYEEQYGSSSQLASALGCDTLQQDLACMRAATVAQILNVSASGNWGPVVDGWLLPGAVPDLLKQGLYKRVPVLAGSNDGEDGFNILGSLAAGQPPLTEAQYEAQTLAMPNGAQILAHYPGANYSSPSDASMAIPNDLFMCTADLGTADILANQINLYLYQFQDDNPPPTFFPGLTVPSDIHINAFHTAEVPYVFQSWYPVELHPGAPPFNAQQQALSDRMIGYWSNFVKYGAPGGTWQPFAASRSVFLLRPGGDATATEQQLDALHQCDFWNSLRP